MDLSGVRFPQANGEKGKSTDTSARLRLSAMRGCLCMWR